MHSLQHIYTGDAVYAPPVLRAPSPSSSIGTDYGPDETPIAEQALSLEEFNVKMERQLRLDSPRPEETFADEEPLLPRNPHPQAEKALFTHVMQNLRKEVRKLQEDEIFERTLLRGSNVSEEQQPSSCDIDDIMRSMMGPAASSRAPTEPTSGSPLLIVSPVPSNASLVGAFTIGSTSDTSATSVSKRPPKAKSKAKAKRT
ncbi:hypothetical protein EUX98_g4140 [Antrodiella citrinella]|uniref:Uncharacterized protein n=1 Tax=Antrodiella citrinella TaxID=2447956 RepID=A0A4S4MVT1_9APHY|nr:hypothetical protein EUX98_g4140 [Antrodiella citrinella]